ncbi:uncharacterized protein LOC125216499 [Salvia hispanica]|uniref:uncharacterized protein LOC125216499 n=1 Tax=Salvia hispanica TaxID=49212 RepID=UPI00200978C2|nr:uncharacterized protein LOC125216499 [Salvia hispanica]
MLLSHLPSAADPPRLSQEDIHTSSYFYSAPPTPMHFDRINSASFQFQFSSRFAPTANLPNADDLFFNGHIRPMQLHSGGGDLKFSHRKARSMSPAVEYEAKRINESPSGRNSKKWMFLKDLLHRSKSEGRGNRFWSISLSSPSSSKNHETKRGTKAPVNGKAANGLWRRRVSAHELHYTANRAQAEEMKKKTFLPYRQGLLGCLAFTGSFTTNRNPISSI